MSEQLAKLLATENINVIRKRADTASFDLETRNLVIPILKEGISLYIEHLFIGHEVSHGLNTKLSVIMEYVERLGKKVYEKYSPAINITEDARIDKIIKRRYPGLKTDYGMGLKELRSMDFFDVNSKDLSGLNLLDKVNIFFKGYPEVYGLFTPEEVELVEQIQASENQEESIELGIKLYNLALSQEKQKGESPQTKDNSKKSKEKSEEFESSSKSSEGSGEDLSEESKNSEESGAEESKDSKDKSMESKDKSMESKDSSEKSEDTSDVKGKQSSSDAALANYSNDEIECHTQKSFDEKLKSSFERGNVRVSKNVLENDLINFEKCIHTYKDIIADYPIDANPNLRIYSKITFNEFKNSSKQKVNALVKEFELRKAATRYSRTQVSKSGYIDINKVYKYQYNDDIFKRVVSIQDEKNHGMIFLLDWSASMTKHLHSVVEQMYVLTSFCRQVKIPFKVFAFTSKDSKSAFPFLSRSPSQAHYDSGDYITNSSGKIKLSNVRPFNLFEFLSSDMKEFDYNNMCNRLYNTNFYQTEYLGKYSLGSTPLNSALAYMYFYIPKFKAKFNIEKMTLINLTDGVSHPISRNGGVVALGNTEKFGCDNLFTIFVSPRTKKEYKFEDYKGNTFSLKSVKDSGYRSYRYTAFETSSLIRMIKDDNVTCISISIITNRSEYIDAVMSLTCLPYFEVNAWNKGDSIQDSFYDKSFIVYSKNLTASREAESEKEEILNKALADSSKSLARQIVKNNSKVKKGQVLFNAFIGTIA